MNERLHSAPDLLTESEIRADLVRALNELRQTILDRDGFERANEEDVLPEFYEWQQQLGRPQETNINFRFRILRHLHEASQGRGELFDALFEAYLEEQDLTQAAYYQWRMDTFQYWADTYQVSNPVLAQAYRQAVAQMQPLFDGADWTALSAYSFNIGSRTVYARELTYSGTLEENIRLQQRLQNYGAVFSRPEISAADIAEFVGL